MNRINLITLGVKDIGKSLTFYRDGLGFQTSADEQNPSIVFFKNGGTRLSLYSLESLKKDIGENVGTSEKGFSGFTLAYNAKSIQEVDEIMQKAESAGGMVIKAPEMVFWGGYSGYFSDLDGYYWEVAYSEDWMFDENNMLVIE